MEGIPGSVGCCREINKRKMKIRPAPIRCRAFFYHTPASAANCLLSSNSACLMLSKPPRSRKSANDAESIVDTFSFTILHFRRIVYLFSGQAPLFCRLRGPDLRSFCWGLHCNRVWCHKLDRTPTHNENRVQKDYFLPCDRTPGTF